jgi:hypothetical protein
LDKLLKKIVLECFYRLPHDFTCCVDIYRRKKYWKECGAIFVHVPKAAGTSVSHALYGRALGHFKASEIKKWCPNDFEKLFKFAFVRNPWDRAVSSYRFALKGATDTAGMRMPEQYRIPEFATFEIFVYEWLMKQDLAKIDNVFQPQHLFVADDNKKLLVDYLGKVELFDNEVLEISKIIGRELEALDLNRVTTRGEYVKYYTDSKLINAVGDIYADDIKSFGYDFR